MISVVSIRLVCGVLIRIIRQAAQKIKEEHGRAEQAGSEARRLGKALGEAEAALRKKTLRGEEMEVELNKNKNEVWR